MNVRQACAGLRISSNHLLAAERLRAAANEQQVDLLGRFRTSLARLLQARRSQICKPNFLRRWNLPETSHVEEGHECFQRVERYDSCQSTYFNALFYLSLFCFCLLLDRGSNWSALRGCEHARTGCDWIHVEPRTTGSRDIRKFLSLLNSSCLCILLTTFHSECCKLSHKRSQTRLATRS